MSLSDHARSLANGGLPLIYPAQHLRQWNSFHPSILIPGLLSQGLTLLAGKAKKGKSLFSLSLALGLARGGKVLGREVEAQEVLYLALEDTNERVQERLTAMLQGGPIPPGLYCGYSGWAKEGAELEELEA
jgi:RecA-family ATPase